MGLQESRILNEVHPWLAARLIWLSKVADLIGSKQTLISGNRTLAKQRELWESDFRRPVAFPGCSQHNYGFAADAVYDRAVQISSKGRPRLFSLEETNATMQSAARFAGLTTVSGDPGHVQMYPGSQFKSWSVDRGLCNPSPPRRRPLLSTQLCGPGFASADIGFDADTGGFGVTCFDPF